jgi:hypothetical protein
MHVITVYQTRMVKTPFKENGMVDKMKRQSEMDGRCRE